MKTTTTRTEMQNMVVGVMGEGGSWGESPMKQWAWELALLVTCQCFSLFKSTT